MRLTAQDYRRDAVAMAKALLGTTLCRRLDDGTVLRARIVETEAYFGEEDTACHARQVQRRPPHRRRIRLETRPEPQMAFHDLHGLVLLGLQRQNIMVKC